MEEVAEEEEEGEWEEEREEEEEEVEEEEEDQQRRRQNDTIQVEEGDEGKREKEGCKEEGGQIQTQCAIQRKDRIHEEREEDQKPLRPLPSQSRPR